MINGGTTLAFGGAAIGICVRIGGVRGYMLPVESGRGVIGTSMLPEESGRGVAGPV